MNSMSCGSKNCGSIDSLKVSTRCSFSPRPARSGRWPTATCQGGGPGCASTSGRQPVWSPRWQPAPIRLLVGDRAGRPAAGLIGQALQPRVRNRACHLVTVGLETPAGLRPPGCCGPDAGQHNPTPQGQRLAGGAPSSPARKGRPFLVGQRRDNITLCFRTRRAGDPNATRSWVLLGLAWETTRLRLLAIRPAASAPAAPSRRHQQGGCRSHGVIPAGVDAQSEERGCR
jgi:hypothetical protein